MGHQRRFRDITKVTDITGASTYSLTGVPTPNGWVKLRMASTEPASVSAVSSVDGTFSELGKTDVGGVYIYEGVLFNCSSLLVTTTATSKVSYEFDKGKLKDGGQSDFTPIAVPQPEWMEPLDEDTRRQLRIRLEAMGFAAVDVEAVLDDAEWQKDIAAADIGEREEWEFSPYEEDGDGFLLNEREARAKAAAKASEDAELVEALKMYRARKPVSEAPTDLSTDVQSLSSDSEPTPPKKPAAKAREGGQRGGVHPKRPPPDGRQTDLEELP